MAVVFKPNQKIQSAGRTSRYVVRAPVCSPFVNGTVISPNVWLVGEELQRAMWWAEGVCSRRSAVCAGQRVGMGWLKWEQLNEQEPVLSAVNVRSKVMAHSAAPEQ